MFESKAFKSTFMTLQCARKEGKMKPEDIKIINKILDEKVRPQLREHEGNIELVEIKNDIAYVRMTGHCSGCPSAIYTLESIVKEEILENTNIVKDVKLHQDVDPELYDFAKKILNKEISLS